ncbi:hypothetical protein AN189_18070 [Loktanella sp. 3ANDIMAR09]|uniref:hypothetical protein n=1 Tax=Loktanella sp. 3ANDIMAR09 TaxID=1225657 RepID=UPI0006F78AAC|nr:hypothetical protein [Loktanella sp. 3ANDIMAR09]KQI66962.1 hypothetical protein AN189_18070 [Loktanella sp. 3ANDIMAR09]
MTDKVIMKFTKAHGVYVPGDVAGFDPVRAAKLQAVARPFDPEKDDLRKVSPGGISDAELTAGLQDLAAREAAVAEREAELAAKLAALESAGGAGTGEKTAGDPPAAKSPGEPPKPSSK